MSDLNAKLFEAVKGNNIKELKKLIAEGADVNVAHIYEFFLWTPLHLAVSKNYEEIVCALLEQDNINVNAEDKFAKTPLHLATIYNHKKVAYALLEQDGINVNAKDSSGNTPLNYAYDNDIIAILKEKGAVAEEYKSENIPLYSMTDKETEFDEFTSLESEIQPLSDFEQFMQSDQLI